MALAVDSLKGGLWSAFFARSASRSPVGPRLAVLQATFSRPLQNEQHGLVEVIKPSHPGWAVLSLLRTAPLIAGVGKRCQPLLVADAQSGLMVWLPAAICAQAFSIGARFHPACARRRCAASARPWPWPSDQHRARAASGLRWRRHGSVATGGCHCCAGCDHGWSSAGGEAMAS